MVSLFTIIEIISICILFIAMGILLSDAGSREHKLMCYFLCGCLVQNAGYLLELNAASLEAAVVAIKVQYLGSIFVPICYCWFIYNYCHERISPKLLKTVGAIDFAVLLMVFSCDYNTLYYRSMEWMVTESGHHYLNLEYGPGYLLFLICSSVIPYALSLYALFRTIVSSPDHVSNRKYKVIVLLSLLPVAALISYVWKLTRIFDLTPSVLGIVLSLVAILVWSRRNYDFNSLAAEVVLDSMGDGVIALDDQRRLISYNEAAVNIFKELASRRIGDSIAGMEEFPEGVLEENTKREFSVGERYYESHVKKIPDKDGNGQGYVILVLDVTDTRNYIEEIKSVREQAEKANMAKSEFLANMSHEIRTPMNAVIGLSDIIMEESWGRKVYSYACDIKSAAKNLLAIINDVLDLSKVEAGKMELVPSNYYVKTIVDEVVNMMDIAASQHGIAMKCEFDRQIPCRYYGDEGRVKQILINILSNAVKFTKEGSVKISVGGRPGNTQEEEILVFRVEDTGCGIKEEDLEHIFENFRQVDSKRNRTAEGTGLGLSITRHLVKLMNGKIEVESVYGEGTVFTVAIPQKIVDKRTLEEVPEVPAGENEKIDFFRAEGYHILIVDDNRINRKVARGFLKTYGFEMSEAASGPEAIELVQKTKYDIIFMDHMMPGMDGIEATHIIREDCGENGRTPVVIAFTANAMEGVREKFLKSGFQDFVVKPLDRKSLHEVLMRWIPEKDRQYRNDMENVQPAEEGGLSFADIHIEGIDVEEAMKHHSGGVEDYQELLQLYCLDGKRKLGLLKELTEKKDYKTYEIEVHGLKSASANIGAMELSVLAREQEEAAGRKDEAFISENFAELISSYEKQMKQIQSFLDKTQVGTEQEDEKAPPIGKEEFLHEISAALEMLENFHSRECAEKIKGLLKYRLDADVQTKLKEIQEQLKMYEDDTAELLLHQLLEFLNGED